MSLGFIIGLVVIFMVGLEKVVKWASREDVLILMEFLAMNK